MLGAERGLDLGATGGRPVRSRRCEPLDRGQARRSSARHRSGFSTPSPREPKRAQAQAPVRGSASATTPSPARTLAAAPVSTWIRRIRLADPARSGCPALDARWTRSGRGQPGGAAAGERAHADDLLAAEESTNSRAPTTRHPKGVLAQARSCAPHHVEIAHMRKNRILNYNTGKMITSAGQVARGVARE